MASYSQLNIDEYIHQAPTRPLPTYINKPNTSIMKTATILALASSAIASVISLNSRDFAPKVKTRQAQTIEEGLNACEDKTIPCTVRS